MQLMIDFLTSLFLKSTNILILGFGKEGRSTYSFIRRHFPDIQLVIADLNTEIESDLILLNDTNIELITGDNYLNSLNVFDIIIKSPGVKIKNVGANLISKITSQTDLFLQCYASQVIGVTGTKGKSTTVSLIKHFIDSDDKKGLLLGNIGMPAFDMIELIESDTIIIYELSAHQLEYLHTSPHIAVLLNVFPEHLDYFDSYENYMNSKFNIFRYQDENDCLIVNESIIRGDQIAKSKEQVVSEKVITVCDNNLIFNIENSPLQGKHNIVNINFALLAVIEMGVDVDVAIKSLDSFVPLVHRLEYVGEFDGIKFVNDSISTVPQSTIAAVKALDKVDTLILGGFDRGLDYSQMVDFLALSNVNNFIFLGRAGDRMYDGFKSNSNKNLIVVSSIEDAFNTIVEITRKGSICLLSPAAASYDQFHNFEHRGDVFKMLVRKL